MATGQRPGQVRQAIQHPGPGEKEMPAPAHRQVLRARNRAPSRKAADHRFAALVFGDAQHAGRFEARVADARDAVQLATLAMHRLRGEQRRVEMRSLAPIQRGMGVVDLQPAADQRQHAEQVDPVHQAQRPAMAQDRAPFKRGRLFRGRSRRRGHGGAPWRSDAALNYRVLPLMRPAAAETVRSFVDCAIEAPRPPRGGLPCARPGRARSSGMAAR
jgi:hypothetical protein